MAAAIRPHSTLSHWNTMIENLETSPKAFYDSVEKALADRKVEHVSVTRVHWKEGGPLSAKREYLQVKRFGHVFHICGAPFGNGFFVSWWLGEVKGCLARLFSILSWLPFFEDLLPFANRAATYYQIDTALMFRSLTHSSVLEVIDGLTEAKGLRRLSELERKPIQKDFLSLSPLG